MTYLGNRKGTGKWQVYISWFVLLVQSLKEYLIDWGTWRWEDEWTPSKLQHYWEWPEYWEEYWRHEETCSHSNSSEWPLTKADVKNCQGEVIDWEMCKKLKFDHTNKWYMHNPAPVLENDTHRLLWDFGINTDNLISARRPDQIITNKRKRESAKVSTLRSRMTTEYNWKNVKRKISTSNLPGNRKKKNMEHEGDNYTNCNWYFWNSNYRIIKETEGLGSWRTSGDHSNL